MYVVGIFIGNTIITQEHHLPKTATSPTKKTHHQCLPDWTAATAGKS